MYLLLFVFSEIFVRKMKYLAIIFQNRHNLYVSCFLNKEVLLNKFAQVGEKVAKMIKLQTFATQAFKLD